MAATQGPQPQRLIEISALTTDITEPEFNEVRMALLRAMELAKPSMIA